MIRRQAQVHILTQASARFANQNGGWNQHVKFKKSCLLRVSTISTYSSMKGEHNVWYIYGKTLEAVNPPSPEKVFPELFAYFLVCCFIRSLKEGLKEFFFI
jgi:hypothetical protein